MRTRMFIILGVMLLAVVPLGADVSQTKWIVPQILTKKSIPHAPSAAAHFLNRAAIIGGVCYSLKAGADLAQYYLAGQCGMQPCGTYGALLLTGVCFIAGGAMAERDLNGWFARK